MLVVSHLYGELAEVAIWVAMLTAGEAPEEYDLHEIISSVPDQGCERWNAHGGEESDDRERDAEASDA